MRLGTIIPIPPPLTRRHLRSLKSVFSFLLRFLFFLFKAMSQNPQNPDPQPFDPTKPSTPISYPIKTLQELESRSYFDSFHFHFNRASVPLRNYAAGPLPARRRLLVCHDMQGGYLDDRWVQGGMNPDAYAIWHWYLMDLFVYFSHELVSLPPPCWTNAAHAHGVRVLGTFLTEWDAGRATCNILLATKSSAQLFAERLAELAVALGFDGWLINMEVNLDLAQISNLKEFVGHLTRTMHSSIPGSLVIWYDAVTEHAKLDWQDQLNEKNEPFFNICDGIFVNYTWKENYPKLSADFAGDRRYDVYMGIDVFGRNTFGGGQWNTNVALDVLKDTDISAAIFAPGWVYETKQEPDFQTAQNRWWALIEKSWGLHQSYPKEVPFHSNFDQGHGYHFSVGGSPVGFAPWNNISCQGFQPLLNGFNDPDQLSMQAFINFNEDPYNGGGSFTIRGSLINTASYSTRLFHGELPCGELPLCISYSVKLSGSCLLGLSLTFSRTNTRTSYLISNDTETIQNLHLEKNYGRIISPLVKKTNEISNSEWFLCEASIQMSNYTLTDIRVVCYMKQNASSEEQGIVESYNASLGHISIRATEQTTEFPPADSWIIEGQHISWATSPLGAKSLSLKLIWRPKAGAAAAAFMKYNIYVEKQSKQAHREASNIDTNSMVFLGTARIEAFFVSDLEIPNGITGLKFVVQVCGVDGGYQNVDLSPAFLLAVEGQ